MNFGILMLPHPSTAAAGLVDILLMCSRSYPTELGHIPDGVTQTGLSMEIYYITTDTEPPPEPIGIYQSLQITPYYECPPLNYLLISGSSSAADLSDDCARFLESQVTGAEAVFTTYTGTLLLAQTRLLDDTHVAIPCTLLRQVQQRYPSVLWTASQRWIVDGRIRSAASSYAAMDMIVHWVIEKFNSTVTRST
ncbi:hypothetical protein BDV26DRAFT_293050 [Aspergillus bertholletiae]|uniref:DJ-1/PfpI domain-containing protein n=1 Tax=Aspergillus bertholletiae TaxID=1226010 RepID=A0A5N7B6M8_9EURO|nr:hypothetical protein BDV26DRAFT_293050 [Aspergillus bertholletiae]